MQIDADPVGRYSFNVPAHDSLIRNSNIDRDRCRNALARQRRLVDHCAVRPLRRCDVIDFASQPGDIHPVLRLDFIQSHEMRHNVSRVPLALRDEHVHARSRRPPARARRLLDDGVHGLVRRAAKPS